MAKVAITYDLPEEVDDLKAALQGKDLQLVLWNVDQYLRSKIKYATSSEETHKAYTELREFIHSELEDKDVTLE